PMLAVPGRSARFCDGLDRRDFLRIGTLAFGAASLSLADVFRAEARAGSTSTHKAVINIFLAGGPAHQDTFDLKPDAPVEARGESNPLPAGVPGIQGSEIFPKLAARMDRVAVVRWVVGSTGRHDAFQCMTGWDNQSLSGIGGRPSLGAAAARLQGPVDASVPPFVGLAAPTEHLPWSDGGKPGFLGTAFAPFRPEGDGLDDMKLTGINRDNLADRKALLASFDRLRRDVDVRGGVSGLDAAQERALNVLTSSRLWEALDLTREDPKVRAAYGDGKPYQYQYDGAPTANDQLLIARRLIEAGVRVVTLS